VKKSTLKLGRYPINFGEGVDWCEYVYYYSDYGTIDDFIGTVDGSFIRHLS